MYLKQRYEPCMDTDFARDGANYPDAPPFGFIKEKTNSTRLIFSTQGWSPYGT